METTFEIEWGLFSLIEFIVSSRDKIGTKYKTALDIGSGEEKLPKFLGQQG